MTNTHSISATYMSWKGILLSFSCLFISSPGTLQASDWIALTTQAEGEYIRINWSIAPQPTLLSFVVERSQDGFTFGEIAEVKSQGISGPVQRYSYVDKLEVVAQFGSFFYRLKKVDVSGEVSYTDPVQVTDETSASALFLAISTSKTKDFFSLRYRLSSVPEARLQVSNNLGQPLFHHTLQGQGEGGEIKFDTRNWEEGLYYIRLQANGQSRSVKLRVKRPGLVVQ